MPVKTSLLIASAFVATAAILSNAEAAGNITLRLSSSSLGDAVATQSIPKSKIRGTSMPQLSTQSVPVGGGPGVLPLPSAPAARALAPNSSLRTSSGGITSYAYGNSPLLWPYTTSRVASSSANATGAVQDNPVSSTPFRQTGLLLTAKSGGIFQCSASLIMPNVIVTAAHCVQDYGTAASGSITGAVWIPANTEDPFTSPTPGPFGVWEAVTSIVPPSYYYGYDTCSRSAPGIFCNNDLAVLSLAPLNGQKAGDVLGGTYAYGANGYSFVRSKAFKNAIVGDVTQLGYPAEFDNGATMQRNNSFAKYITSRGTKTNNRKVLMGYQLGSALSQGASGGPLLVNFGTPPSVGSGASLGLQSYSNVVVGVASYGYVEVGVNVQGATFFGQNPEFPLADYGGFGPGNIGAMLQTVCGLDPAACTY